MADPQPETYPVYPADGFVFHHSGGTTLEGLRATLADRGLGSEYLMDRDGTIYNYAGAGSPHIQPNDQYGGIAPGLTNRNAVGMEVVARDDADVTPAQVAAAQHFISTYYPDTPVYGHGEVNPGHKQATEGLTITNAIRTARQQQAQGSSFFSPSSAEAAEIPPGAGRSTMGWELVPETTTTTQPPQPTAQPQAAGPDPRDTAPDWAAIQHHNYQSIGGSAAPSTTTTTLPQAAPAPPTPPPQEAAPPPPGSSTTTTPTTGGGAQSAPSARMLSSYDQSTAPVPPAAFGATLSPYVAAARTRAGIPTAGTPPPRTIGEVTDQGLSGDVAAGGAPGNVVGGAFDVAGHPTLGTGAKFLTDIAPFVMGGYAAARSMYNAAIQGDMTAVRAWQAAQEEMAAWRQAHGEAAASWDAARTAEQTNAARIQAAREYQQGVEAGNASRQAAADRFNTQYGGTDIGTPPVTPRMQPVPTVTPTEVPVPQRLPYPTPPPVATRVAAMSPAPPTPAPTGPSFERFLLQGAGQGARAMTPAPRTLVKGGAGVAGTGASLYTLYKIRQIARLLSSLQGAGQRGGEE